MPRAITVSTAAVIAALPLAAASAEEWIVQLSNPILTPANPSTIVTLNPGARTDAYALAGVAWSTHITEPGWYPASFEALISHPGQTVGTLSPDRLSITGQSAGYLFQFGFEPSPPFPDVWRGVFTVTDFSAAREITLTTETSRYEVYPEHSFPPRTEPRPLPREAHAVIQVIPAPASLALLAAGALITSRRRRT